MNHIVKQYSCLVLYSVSSSYFRPLPFRLSLPTLCLDNISMSLHVLWWPPIDNEQEIAPVTILLLRHQDSFLEELHFSEIHRKKWKGTCMHDLYRISLHVRHRTYGSVEIMHTQLFFLLKLAKCPSPMVEKQNGVCYT